MDTKYKIFATLALLLSFVGCQTDAGGLLDKEETNDIYEQMVFSDPQYATWFLNGIYREMNSGFYVFGNAGFLGNAVDEGLWKATWDNAYVMSNGAWTTKFLPINYHPWKKYFSAIRATNRFLEHADEIPDAIEPVLMNSDIRKRMKAEARFLRAYFYGELLKFYGGVPLITKVLEASDRESLDAKRSTVDDLTKFVCDEAKAAIADLPDRYDDAQFGRITKGACYALISRLKLMVASPLFNDPTNAQNCEFRGAYREDKWKEAAEAAKDFMTACGSDYSLHRTTSANNYGDYEDLFIRRYSPEIILSYQQEAYAVDLERICLPGQFFNYANGVTNSFPLLNAVAEYEVVELNAQGEIVDTHLLGIDKVKECDDKGIVDPVSGFDPQDPYKNRDPRFYQSIWYNNEPWPARGTNEGSTLKFEPWVKENLTDPGNDGAHCLAGFYSSGFFNRKFLDAYANLTGYTTNPKVVHNFIIFRYAEILLNYAEAVNEAFDNPYTAPAGYPMSAVDAIDMVRERARFPDYANKTFKWPVGMPLNAVGKSISPIPNGLSKAEIKARIKHERRVEFFQEEHRFWDLMRWKERTAVKVYKQTIKKKTNGTFVYGIEEIMQKAWNDKFYLFPILEDEMQKCKNLIQNPGWSN